MNMYVYENTKIELLSFVRVYEDDDEGMNQNNSKRKVCYQIFYKHLQRQIKEILLKQSE